MAAAITYPTDEREYRRRIRAWTLYDWANSAFATTILAAVLPVYYSQVAGATLPSEAVATSYWSLGLSLSLFIAAVLSPILGTISDIKRGKKRFLSVFTAIGILGTASLVLVGTGDWFIASVFAVIGRIGFNGGATFYDALLPHVAREEDRDRVSTRGFATGYLGGGLLLAINVVMIQVLGFEDGSRLSFLSVAVWWAVFTIPLLRQVPEPAAATEELKPGENVIGASFSRIAETLRDIRRYRQLFRFLIAFLIYNDAIGTIIGVAAIYGAELGFDATELILALLLVQFVGIPFSLIFGYLPSTEGNRRPFFLAFILFNMVALPLTGIVGAQVLPQNITGVLLPPFETVDDFVGTGVHGVDSFALEGEWVQETIAAETLGLDADAVYARADEPGARLAFPFNGQDVIITFSTGPDHGLWAVYLDGEPLDYVIDAYSSSLRYGVTDSVSVEQPGQYTLELVNLDEANAASSGTVMSVARVEVLAPISPSNLLAILGAIVIVQIVGLLFAALVGVRLFSGLASTLNTKRSIILSLVVYGVISVWGYFVASTIEFWMLAWMVAIVQGGSQALSRSLYAAMSPASKSGEFFGLFGVMEKFASFLGPLVFAFAAVTFGSSRPAILALILFFIVGGALLLRVNVDEGRRVAAEEDAEIFGAA